MITCMTIGQNGRLGNQMFQFAALHGISRHKNLKYSFSSGRLYEAFKMNGILNSSFENPRFLYQEKAFSFDANAFQIPDCTELHGYFQTQKYWAHCEKEIIDAFEFRDDVIAGIPKDIIEFCKSSTFLHVRRTDYLTSGGYHPTMTVNYYDTAIEESTNCVSIFSDDPTWCENLKSHLEEKKKTVVLISALGLTDLQELYLMTQCSGAVICNSSFSWWGAFLGPHQRKQKIVAPASWFGNQGPQDTNDIYMNEWIKI